MPLTTSLLPLALTLLGALRLASAQIAFNCSSDLSWLDNGLGQDPCHVASWLYSQCLGEPNYNLTGLGEEYSGYAGPVSTDSSQWTINGCLCSDPMYNLLMACQGACQGKNVLSFAQFTGSCNSSFTGSNSTPTLNFPQQVPSGTEIPPWAFVNNMNGIWSEQQAQNNISGVSSSSTGPTSTGSTTGVGPTSQPTGSSGGGSKSHAGAIAGGVVGGIAVIALIAGAGMYMLRRLRKHDAEQGHGGSSHGGMHEVQPLSMMASHPGNAVSPSNTTSSGAYGHGSAGYPPSSEGGYGVNPFGTGHTPSPGPGGAYGYQNSSTSGGAPISSVLPEVMSSSGHSEVRNAGGVASPAPHGIGNIYEQDRYDQYQGR